MTATTFLTPTQAGPPISGAHTGGPAIPDIRSADHLQVGPIPRPRPTVLPRAHACRVNPAVRTPQFMPGGAPHMPARAAAP